MFKCKSICASLRVLSILLCFVIYLSLQAHAAQPKRKFTADTSLQLLKSGAERSGVTLVSADELSDVLAIPARPFSLVLLFTASRRCSICETVLDEITLAARASQLARATTSHDIYFLVLDAARGKDAVAFTTYSLETIPFVVFLPVGGPELHNATLMEVELSCVELIPLFSGHGQSPTDPAQRQPRHGGRCATVPGTTDKRPDSF